MSESVTVPLADEESNCSLELFKSWDSFARHFGEATRMKVITYCESPEFILDVFDELDSLRHLEVCVGDVDDYRERLINKPNLAERLERLRRERKLVINLFPTKDVHTKLYLIEDGKTEETRCIVGSPNLSKTAWTRQANVGVVFTTSTGSWLHRQLDEFYEQHKRSYQYEEFLEVLTDEIEAADESREEIIDLYVNGRTGMQSEVSEIHSTVSDYIDEAFNDLHQSDSDGATAAASVGDDDEDNDEDIENGTTSVDSHIDTIHLDVPLNGYSDATLETLEELEAYEATVTDRALTTTARAFHEYHREQYGVPQMRVVDLGDEEALLFGMDEVPQRVDAPLPNDPDEVDVALDRLETFYGTVDRYGKTNNGEMVKAHMLEATLHLFWAPFAHRHAAFYRDNDLSDPGKNLPFLYIHGESNAGKGTFARYILGLISDGRVQTAQDADGFKLRRVRSLINTSDTTFPVVVDDIERDGVEDIKSPLCNYWDNWREDNRFPILAFISNHTRPKKWFRNRAKTLHFDVAFDSDNIPATSHINSLISEENPVYKWFARQYLETPLELHDNGDTLAEARSALLKLYEYAGRDEPDYFPYTPAERRYDLGRVRWQNAYDRNRVSFTVEDKLLVADFSSYCEKRYEVTSFARDAPTKARPKTRGTMVEFHDPEEFRDWFGEMETTSTIFGRLRGVI